MLRKIKVQKYYFYLQSYIRFAFKWIFCLICVFTIIACGSLVSSSKKTITSEPSDISFAQLPATAPVVEQNNISSVSGTALPQPVIQINSVNADALRPMAVIPLKETTGFTWFSDSEEIAASTPSQIAVLNLRPPTTLDQIETLNSKMLTVPLDQRAIAWVDQENRINYWRLDFENQIINLGAISSPITSLTFSPGGEALAYATYDRSVKIWDTKSFQTAQEWQAPSWLSNLSYSPDGSMVGGSDLANFTVYIFNATTGAVQHTLQWIGSASPALYGAYFSPDWRNLAWVARGTVQLMIVENGVNGPTLEHEDFISAIAWSPDGLLVATAAAGTVNGDFVPVVYLWDRSTGNKIGEFSQVAPVLNLAFSPDGTQLAVLTNGGTVQVFGVIE